MREGLYSDVNPQLIGDVVISMDTCIKEAQEANLSVEQRYYQLLIHGILHLFGYDHIQSADEARIMDAKSDELLALISAID